MIGSLKKYNLINYFSTQIEGFSIKSNVVGLVRSLFALGSICTLLFNDATHLFNPTGIANPVYENLSLYKISIFYIMGYNLSLAKCLSIIILLVVISGYFPRYTAIFHWWISFSIFTSSFIVEGGDQITQIVTLFLIPICLFDDRKNHWHNVKNNQINKLEIVPFFFLHLIKLQVCILYLDASLGKLKCDEWVNGTALYYWFSDPNFGLNNFFKTLLWPLITSSIILPFLTWFVLLFEFFLFLCIVALKKHHSLFLRLGILFHFAIFLFHGLFSFFLAMTATLILYLTNFKKINND